MRPLRFFYIWTVLSALLLAGCGGGGDDVTTVGTGSAGATVPGGGGQTQNMNALLNGQYGLLSAGVGPTARSLTTGVITADGQGGITGGSGTVFVYNPATNTVNTLNRSITSGFYNVTNARVFTGQIVTNDGTVTDAIDGGLSSNDVFASANWRDSNQDAGQFMLIRTLSNPSNASLTGTYRFSAAQVGLFEGFVFGTLTFDGNGAVTGGQITRSNNTVDQITSGTYQMAADGSLTGTIVAGGLTTNFSGYLGADLTLGFTTSDDFGNLGLGVATPGPTSTSSNPDLSGSYSYLALRTSPAVSRGFATGQVQADGNGAFTGGSILYSDGATATITGGDYNILPDGTFTVPSGVITSDGVTTQTDFLTLHRDKTVASGVIRDSRGNQGVVLLVR
jgi:hypothetical protein